VKDKIITPLKKLTGAMSRLQENRRILQGLRVPFSKAKSDSYDSLNHLLLAPYRLLGDRVNRFLPFFGDLEKQLLRANIKVAFRAYVAFMVFFSFLGGVSVFASFVLIGILLGATLTTTFGLAFVLGLTGLAIVFVTLYAYPSTRADGRRRILDEELPYVASHMAVLSRAGLSPERIFGSLTAVEAAGIRSVAAEEAANIDRDIHFLGYDVISAMEKRMKNSPSKRFVDLLDGFVSVARSGGDLTSYFMTSAKGFMDLARISARQLIETLGGIAEAYVSIMVVFPLLIVVMLSIMNMIGGGLGGFSTIFIMQVVTYLAIPVLAIIILILLDSIMPPK
jgi:flagellar protein FlaJ